MAVPAVHIIKGTAGTARSSEMSDPNAADKPGDLLRARPWLRLQQKVGPVQVDLRRSRQLLRQFRLWGQHQQPVIPGTEHQGGYRDRGQRKRHVRAHRSSRSSPKLPAYLPAASRGTAEVSRPAPMKC